MITAVLIDPFAVVLALRQVRLDQAAFARALLFPFTETTTMATRF